jgi:iron complex transport system substrate-binding protein
MHRLLPGLLFLLCLTGPLSVSATPEPFNDADGRTIRLLSMPQRVVSLVPAVTEMLLALNKGEVLVGTTHHSLTAEAPQAAVVGGFLQPDLARVTALNPDLVFFAEPQREAVQALAETAVLVRLAPASLEEGLNTLTLLGRIFAAEDRAAALVDRQRQLLALIAAKTATISATDRPRVIRLMASDRLLVPGDDSFQNDFIDAAGGQAPRFGRDGQVIALEPAEWQAFDPEVIYRCGPDHDLPPILDQPGWREVSAVRTGRILTYPCDLTCRLGAHPGDFVARLAADLHQQHFSDPAQQVLPEQVTAKEDITLDYSYLKQAKIVRSDIRDFANATLLLQFNRPMRVLSTLEGERNNVRFAGNHSFPPPAWGLGHEAGYPALRDHTLKVLGLEGADTALLFTGASMDNLAVVEQRFAEMQVTALVTAGVSGNAQRMGADAGLYYEEPPTEKPGTINILLLTNRQLSSGAMSRAVITASEAKSAALADLDIRSGPSPTINPATGTGTDNIIVIEGDGPPAELSGGHSRLGELIARAVHAGVVEAVRQQNGLTAERSIFQRLKERRINLSELVARDTALAMERLLLQPAYSSFLSASLAISDAFERRLIIDLEPFAGWCRQIAEQIAGQPVQLADLQHPGLPTVLRQALGALQSGLAVATAGAEPPPPPAPTGLPKRIVSLGPINTENIYLLGAEDRLVANTSYCVRPMAAREKPKIGSVMEVSVEKVISLQPDLILATNLSPDGPLKKFTGLGIPVVRTAHADSFAAICSQFIELGRLLGLEERARAEIDIAQAKVEAIGRVVADQTRPKVFLQVGTTPLSGSVPGSFTDDFIRLGGGSNILADMSDAQVNQEKILAENPEVIIIAIMGNETGLAEQEKRNWQRFPALSAVRHNRVHTIDPDLVCSPSPATFTEALATIATLIHPDLKFPEQP